MDVLGTDFICRTKCALLDCDFCGCSRAETTRISCQLEFVSLLEESLAIQEIEQELYQDRKKTGGVRVRVYTVYGFLGGILE